MMLNNNVGEVEGGVHDGGAAAQRGVVANHHHHHHQRGLKKGPWTAAEDAILMEYVKKHGEGNWNAVQKNSGLARCGKSCRLRWANHLRPNLKKGSLSPEEERLIIELHAKLGNKWARMASQLPGRTDNEIKNYWNTRMKRRQRAGLPIYPHDVQHEAATVAFHHHHHQQLRHSSSGSSASSFPSLLSSSHQKSNYTNPTQLSLYDHISNNNYHHHHHNSSSIYPMSTKQFNSSNGGYALPLSPVSQFGSSPSSALFNQPNNINPNQTLLSSTNYNSPGGFGGYSNLSMSSMLMGPPSYDVVPSAAVVPGSNLELPLNQTPPSIHGGEVSMGGYGSTTSEDLYAVAPVVVTVSQVNSGLLDDVLVESDKRSSKRAKSGDSSSGWSGKEKGLVPEEEEFPEDDDEDTVQVESTLKNSGDNSAQNYQRDDSSSPSSIGMKQSEDLLEEMDDDLLSLLNFSSAAMPAASDQSWYLGCMSNRESMSGVSTSDNVGVEIQQNAPLVSPVKTSPTSDEVNQTMGSCFWNNMPGIC